jgi:hypothetical protein
MKLHRIIYNKKLFIIFLQLASLCIFSFSPKETENLRRISGVISYEDEGVLKRLPNATIIVKSTPNSVEKTTKQRATVSNSRGKYSLDVPENATLVFLSMGMKRQEIVIDTQQIINVVMESAGPFEDVQIMGTPPLQRVIQVPFQGQEKCVSRWRGSCDPCQK